MCAQISVASSEPADVANDASSFEKECNALQKESKSYIDAVKGTFVVTGAQWNSGVCPHPLAMTSAQARLAETLEAFYGGAEQANEGAMAVHAYKRAVEEMESATQRELVRPALLVA